MKFYSLGGAAFSIFILFQIFLKNSLGEKRGTFFLCIGSYECKGFLIYEGSEYCDDGYEDKCELYHKRFIKYGKREIEYDKSEIVTESGRFGVVYFKGDPVEFPLFTTDKNATLYFKLQIWDSDGWAADDKLEEFSHNFTDPLMPSKKLKYKFYNRKRLDPNGQPASSYLGYHFRLECEPFFYGNLCKEYCKPQDNDDGHYTCDTVGRHVCATGWEGPPECKIRVNLQPSRNPI